MPERERREAVSGVKKGRDGDREREGETGELYWE